MRLHSYKSSGNCLKVRLLLGLLGQPVELVETDIFAGDTLTDAFGRLNPLRETPVLERLDLGGRALDLMEAHLRERRWYVGASPTVADIALYPYTSAAPDAGLPLDRWPAVGRWLEETRALPGFVDDWEPYPANARPGVGRSIYD